MQQFLEIFVYCIMALSVINLLRLAIFMIGADLYDLFKMSKPPIVGKPYRPFITVIIPAHNEELCIVRTVQSVLNNSYANKKIVVVDDGSTDSTYAKLRYFKAKHKLNNLKIVHQANQGKAAGINNALKNHTRGSSLVMVLDADSILDKNAIKRMIRHFSDKRVVTAAANVKVIDGFRPLTIAQRLEYVISHRMKRALTTLNMEYIVGGVGSTFRKDIVQACNYYDTDTMTEDIDFTMKVIAQQGNRKHRIIFASDVIAYTEGVVSFKSLVRQRFRWKYGRMQTFFKNKSVFFSRNTGKHTKRLTWAYLPFIVFSECILLFEPILIAVVMYLAWTYGGGGGLLTVYIMSTFFYAINIIADDSEALRPKLKLLSFLPFAYFLILIMSFVDFLALVMSMKRLHKLADDNGQHSRWQHVERVGKAVSV